MLAPEYLEARLMYWTVSFDRVISAILFISFF
jgi:hypothetical protein